MSFYHHQFGIGEQRKKKSQSYYAHTTPPIASGWLRSEMPRYRHYKKAGGPATSFFIHRHVWYAAEGAFHRFLQNDHVANAFLGFFLIEEEGLLNVCRFDWFGSVWFGTNCVIDWHFIPFYNRIRICIVGAQPAVAYIVLVGLWIKVGSFRIQLSN